VEVFSVGVTGTVFNLFCWTTIFGCNCVGEATVVIDGATVVVVEDTVVIDGATVVGGDSEVDCEESVLSTEVAVNASLPPAVDEKSPRAVQFLGVEQETE
jgi:hypothetical protein